MQDNSARLWCILSTYTGIRYVNCPFNSYFTVQLQAWHNYAVLLVLKSGWW